MAQEFKRLFSGREYHKNDPAVIVDYNTADPVVRWDSYENFNQRYQDSLEGNYYDLCNLYNLKNHFSKQNQQRTKKNNTTLLNLQVCFISLKECIVIGLFQILLILKVL